MERRSKRLDSTQLSSVERQFSPSRVEHQLLAQVFEIVVSPRCSGRRSKSDCVDDRPSNDERQHTDGRSFYGNARSAA